MSLRSITSTKYFFNIPEQDLTTYQQIESLVGDILPKNKIDIKKISFPNRVKCLEGEKRKIEIFYCILSKALKPSELLKTLEVAVQQKYIQEKYLKEFGKEKNPIEKVIEIFNSHSNKKYKIDHLKEKKVVWNQELEKLLVKRDFLGDGAVHKIFKDDEYRSLRKKVMHAKYLLCPNAFGVNSLYLICKKGDLESLKNIPLNTLQELFRESPSPFEGALYNDQAEIVKYILNHVEEVTLGKKHFEAIFKCRAIKTLKMLEKEFPKLLGTTFKKMIPELLLITCLEDDLKIFEHLTKQWKQSELIIFLVKERLNTSPILNLVKSSSKKIFTYLLSFKDTTFRHGWLFSPAGKQNSCVSLLIENDNNKLLRLTFNHVKPGWLLSVPLGPSQLNIRMIPYAIHCKAFRCLELLAQKEAKWEDIQGNNLAHIACLNGHKPFIEFLWHNFGPLFFQQNQAGLTPLLQGCVVGQLNALEPLFKKEVLINVRGPDGNILHHLLLGHHQEEELLSVIQTIPTKYFNQMINGYLPIHLAALRGYKQITLFLASQMKVEALTSKGQGGNTFFHLFVQNCQPNQAEIQKTLSFTGEKILEIKNNNQELPLHLATGVPQTFYDLLSFSKSLSVYDIDGYTPVHRLFLNCGPLAELFAGLSKISSLQDTVKTTKNTLLHLSVIGRVDQNRVVYQQNGVSLDFFIIDGIDEEWMQFLVKDVGIGIDTQNSEGLTPMHLLFKEGHSLHKLGLLLEYKASFKSKDNKGKLPIEYLSSGNLEFLEDFFNWAQKEKKQDLLKVASEDIQKMYQLFIQASSYTALKHPKSFLIDLIDVSPQVQMWSLDRWLEMIFKKKSFSHEAVAGWKKIYKKTEDASLNFSSDKAEHFLFKCVLYQILDKIKKSKDPNVYYKDIEKIAKSFYADKEDIKDILKLYLRTSGKKGNDFECMQLEIVWEIWNLRFKTLKDIFLQSLPDEDNEEEGFFQMPIQSVEDIWHKTLLDGFGLVKKQKLREHEEYMNLDIVIETMKSRLTPFQILGHLQKLLKKRPDWKVAMKDAKTNLVEMAMKQELITLTKA